jgi:hypothetical protein
MAFGQPSGPPATAKQVQQLLALLHEAGHTDFRDARGPMGFNQRQAAGKFTRDEADTFIEQLEAEGEAGQAPPEPAPAPAPAARPAPRAPARGAVKAAPAPALTSTEKALRTIPSTMLAAELQRRGWAVLEP